MSLRDFFHRYVPTSLDQPASLALRLLRTGDGAALFAMGAAAAGVVMAPLDLALSPIERRLYRRAGDSAGPIALVCGAPRAGTTIVQQTLVRNLAVTHFTNLTALFPASPLLATRLSRRLLSEPASDYHSFYGRTSRLSGLNDALYLWDRWLGRDRATTSPRLSPRAGREMRQFFAAWTAAAGRPLVAKCNHLNASAHLVAEALPEAVFICVERDPLWLGQSLLKAREFMYGDRRRPYGVAGIESACGDDVESVARQVRLHGELAARQERLIGPARFWRVRYEEFCRDPAAIVRRVGRALIGQSADELALQDLAPFECANRRTLDAATFQRLEAAVAEVDRDELATAAKR